MHAYPIEYPIRLCNFIPINTRICLILFRHYSFFIYLIFLKNNRKIRPEIENSRIIQLSIKNVHGLLKAMETKRFYHISGFVQIFRKKL